MLCPVSEHLHILSTAREILDTLILDQGILQTSTPTLLHPDLHKRNIFVSETDPTIVTGIIDWQSTSTEPAFYYANESPDFATIVNENETTILCAQAFDACMKGLVPRMAAARARDEDLLWLPGDCPYVLPEGDEMATHESHLRYYVDSMKIKNNLVRILGTARNGWVASDAWVSTEKAHQAAFEFLMQEIRDSDDPSFTTADLIAMWPFDLPGVEKMGK